MLKFCCVFFQYLHSKDTKTANLCILTWKHLMIRRPCTQTTFNQQKTISISLFIFQIQHIVSRLRIMTIIILVFVPQRAPTPELSLTYFITFIYSTFLGRLCSFGFLNAFKLYKSKPTKHGHAWKRNILNGTKNRFGNLPIYPFLFSLRAITEAHHG